jgi:hypothetical protein
LANGFFLFQFLLGENGSKVLKGGPWLIGGRVFILKKMGKRIGCP